MNQHYPTVVFQPERITDYMFTPHGYTKSQFTDVRSNISGKLNYYLARALAYIQYIIRMIQSSAPFIEKYQPVLNDLPKMYHLVKAFNELKQEKESKHVNPAEGPHNEHSMEQSITYEGPAPKLFI